MTPIRATRLRVAPASHGFTLLETLLALLIFSTAVISLVQAINDTGRTVLLSRRERHVQSRIETRLVEATRSPELLIKMRTTQPQQATAQEGDVNFITRTAPLALKNQEGQPLPGMMSVGVTARWKEGREEQEVSAETWLYLPLFLPSDSTNGS